MGLKERRCLILSKIANWILSARCVRDVVKIFSDIYFPLERVMHGDFRYNTEDLAAHRLCSVASVGYARGVDTDRVSEVAGENRRSPCVPIRASVAAENTPEEKGKKSHCALILLACHACEQSEKMTDESCWLITSTHIRYRYNIRRC